MRQSSKSWIVAILVSALSWSCFEIDQEVKLKKDLSGTAQVGMKVDLQPMILIMAAMQRGFGGKKGAPTKAEINAVKKKMLKDQKSKVSKKELKAEKERLQAGMPEGVKITKLNAKVNGARMSYDFRFSFDDVTKLAQLQLDKKEEGSGGSPGPKNPIDRPFESLKIVDEGKTLLIANVPTNPSEGTQDSMKLPAEGDDDAGLGKTLQAALKDMKVTFKLSVPFRVVDSNATKTKGKNLTWSYGIEDLEKLSESEAADGMWVRIEKPEGIALDHISNLQQGGAAPVVE